jgi:hypothetical protein
VNGRVLGDMGTLRTVRRIAFTLAGIAGLVAVTAGPAAAGTSFNHAVPVLDDRERQ